MGSVSFLIWTFCKVELVLYGLLLVMTHGATALCYEIADEVNNASILSRIMGKCALEIFLILATHIWRFLKN